MRAWVVVLVACGCGRIGFDHHGDGGTGDSIPGDGPMAEFAQGPLHPLVEDFEALQASGDGGADGGSDFDTLGQEVDGV